MNTAKTEKLTISTATRVTADGHFFSSNWNVEHDREKNFCDHALSNTELEQRGKVGVDIMYRHGVTLLIFDCG